ncbi:hypothetical protein R1flu_023428 [Riccia fluitans]|uniref:Uncharacterized protein n=1 Tax=Riccia fluitans TaxID=41844 RepID=A0ABD1XS27_9MARC
MSPSCISVGWQHLGKDLANYADYTLHEWKAIPDPLWGPKWPGLTKRMLTAKSKRADALLAVGLESIGDLAGNGRDFGFTCRQLSLLANNTRTEQAFNKLTAGLILYNRDRDQPRPGLLLFQNTEPYWTFLYQS